MNAILCSVILTSASTRADGSLGLRFATPELKPEEKTAFFEIQNLNLKMLLQPADGEPVELKEVKGQFDMKTPGQRLRAVIYVWFKESKASGEFEDWYRRQMECLINYVKDQLPQDIEK